MEGGQLIADYGYLKMYVKEIFGTGESGLKEGVSYTQVSLEGQGLFRMYTFGSTIDQFLNDTDGCRLEAENILFQSAKNHAKQVLDCINETTGTNPITGRYQYTPKESFKYKSQI